MLRIETESKKAWGSATPIKKGMSNMRYYNRETKEYSDTKKNENDLEILTMDEMSVKYKDKWVLVEYFNNNTREGYVIKVESDCMDLQKTLVQEWAPDRDISFVQFFGGNMQEELCIL